MTSSQASTHNVDSGVTQSSHASPINIIFDICERILSQHRADNPDIYRLVDLNKQLAAASVQSPSTVSCKHTIPSSEPTTQLSIFDTPLRGAELRSKMQISHHKSGKKCLPSMQILLRAHKPIIASARIHQ